MNATEVRDLLDELPHAVQSEMLRYVISAKAVDIHYIDVAECESAPDSTAPAIGYEVAELDPEVVMRDYPQCRLWFERWLPCAAAETVQKEPEHGCVPC